MGEVVSMSPGHNGGELTSTYAPLPPSNAQLGFRPSATADFW